MASAEEWDRSASVQRRAQILYAPYHPAMLGYRSIHIEEYCMTLKHLGQNSALPTSPEEAVLDYVGNPRRSEEHTSELQSLMRNSYAVFFLQKKKQHTKNN